MFKHCGRMNRRGGGSGDCAVKVRTPEAVRPFWGPPIEVQVILVSAAT